MLAMLKKSLMKKQQKVKKLKNQKSLHQVEAPQKEEDLQNQSENLQQKKKISFSELKVWNDCAFKHKLTYIDGIKGFTGNQYTAFGTAIHYACEWLVQDPKCNAEKVFKDKFVEELKLLDEGTVDKKMALQMVDQGNHLVKFVIPALNEKFEKYEIVSIEEQLFEGITEFETDVKFKGFIDLVIKTDDGKYHVIDWKTCSWGWDMKRRSDPMTVYQLSFYKNYFAKKHNIDPENVETYFALLKRTAKKENVEIFRVTNGKKRVSNAIELLHKSLTHIKSKNYMKNKLSCSRCEFYKTAHCP